VSATAPVQGSRVGTVPWDVHVAAWQVYAALGHGDQSARRIADRGGFSWTELTMLLAERQVYGADPWGPLDDRSRCGSGRSARDGWRRSHE
jgi:hypothetical protein